MSKNVIQIVSIKFLGGNIPLERKFGRISLERKFLGGKINMLNGW